MNQTCVALDLETTGLNPDTDEIIEVGAVKFDHEHVLDTFQTLVNPGRPISYRIQVLCGIKQAELDLAPSFTTIASGLTDFIGDCPVVGHNIAFDLGFLSRKGLKLTNTRYDTWELATLLLFKQSDYSLSSLTRELGLQTPEHRALSDALAAQELFLALLDRTAALDLPTVQTLVRLAEIAEWDLRHYLGEILRTRSRTAFSDNAARVCRTPRQEQPCRATSAPDGTRQRRPLDLDRLAAVLEPGGLLASTLTGYEHRPCQVQMMQSIARAFNESEHLVVEAGTGTGKSVAYLLPSIFYSLQNQVPVVISTNTINLQEQLISKDVPALLRALETIDEPPIKNLRVVQLKGRSNYLCLKKFEALLGSSRLAVEEARLLARIVVWLRTTETGDRAELNLGNIDVPVWSRLCAEYDDRFENKCPHHMKESCFLYRARHAAEHAHLIVVNHALLLSDMTMENSILPSYSHLVVDEAHHFENEATSQFGLDITQWDLLDFFNRFRQESGEQRPTGLLRWLQEAIRGAGIDSARQRDLRQTAESLGTNLERVRLHTSGFVDLIRDFVSHNSPDQGDYDRHLLLTMQKRAQPGWSRIDVAWDDLNLLFLEIARGLDQLYTAFEPLADNGIPGHEHLMLELAYLFSRGDEFRRGIDRIISHPDADNICWLSTDSHTGAVELHSAPLSVAGILEKTLFSTRECVILTGATLTTEGAFDYIRGRLGLRCGQELLLGSPFDYPKSTMIYLPYDMPEPNSPAYQQVTEKALVELCRASQGRALVLFTSHSTLRATQAAIQGPLEQDGILVLAQGVDGSPKQLLNAFKSNSRSVLLGTASFWEGVDVVGDALSVVVIMRLPFNVPSDPVFVARSQLFDNPFTEYAVPQAAIRFKQGFGRLIRSKNDRGVLVIMDRRVQSKNYGPAFLASIPLCSVVRGSLRGLPSSVARWLERQQDRSSSGPA
ncbi:MAG: DEAD/DEAH box helicase family protein [Dehalococcoidia bacterium]|nr:DEAD/DEAH box helicase family protein [Dehalococcoidia bacterium]